MLSVVTASFTFRFLVIHNEFAKVNMRKVYPFNLVKQKDLPTQYTLGKSTSLAQKHAKLLYSKAKTKRGGGEGKIEGGRVKGKGAGEREQEQTTTQANETAKISALTPGIPNPFLPQRYS